MRRARWTRTRSCAARHPPRASRLARARRRRRRWHPRDRRLRREDGRRAAARLRAPRGHAEGRARLGRSTSAAESGSRPRWPLRCRRRSSTASSPPSWTTCRSPSSSATSSGKAPRARPSPRGARPSARRTCASRPAGGDGGAPSLSPGAPVDTTSSSMTMPPRTKFKNSVRSFSVHAVSLTPRPAPVRWRKPCASSRYGEPPVGCTMLRPTWEPAGISSRVGTNRLPVDTSRV